MSQSQIRIMIVDDHKMVRQTWKLLLQTYDDFDIIAECTNGEEAIKMSQTLKPDIILMDINMTPVNGFEATQKIMQAMPEAKVIGMSINNMASYARNMIRMGAKGYVTKHSSPEEMVKAIEEVSSGNTYICEEIREKMNGSYDDDRALP